MSRRKDFWLVTFFDSVVDELNHFTVKPVSLNAIHTDPLPAFYWVLLICLFQRAKRNLKSVKLVTTDLEDLADSELHLLSRIHSLSLATTVVAWENSRQFTTPPLFFPRNDVWERRAKIPYWWRITTQIWVVLLIGWGKCPTWHDQSKALPRSL